MLSVFVGIDLGGSGTRAVLAQGDGHVLAIGQGPTGLLGGGAAGRRHMARALDAALAPIRPLARDADCAVFAGTRGLSIPGRRDSLLLELKTRLPSADVRVANDALIGLWGGLAGREGVAVVAGAGSIALARSTDGQEGRAGGWGYLLGDDGSGYWLGREAVIAYLRSQEGRCPTGELSRLVAEHVRRSSVPETLGWLYRGEDQVERLAELAPLVSRAAVAGDPVARDILDRAGRALAQLAETAARQVWRDSPPDPLNVACCGGVWSAGPMLIDTFNASLMGALPTAQPAPPQLPPVGGAVLLAMGADRVLIPADVLERLRAGLLADIARRARH